MIKLNPAIITSLMLLLVGPAQSQGRMTSAELEIMREYKQSMAIAIFRRLQDQSRSFVQGGVVVVRFVVQRTGLVSDAQILHRSRSEIVDEMALRTVAAGTRFQPFPPALRLPQLVVTVPLRVGAH